MSWTVCRKDNARGKKPDGTTEYIHGYYKSQIETLEKENSRLKQDSTTSILRNDHFEKEIMRLEREKRNTQKTTLYNQAEIESLKAEVARQNQSQEQKIKQKTDAYERRIQDQEREMDELCRQMVLMEKTSGPNQVNRLNTEISILKEELLTANKRIERLRANIDEHERNCRTLERENRDLRVQLVLVEAKHTTNGNTKKQPDTQKQLECKIEQLEKDLQEATKKALEESSHVVKSKYLEEEVTRLKSEHKESASTIANLQNKNGQLEMQVLMCTDRLKDQQQELDKIQEKMNQMKAKREREEMKQKKENVENLVNQNDFLQKDIANFLTQAQEAESRLKGKDDQMEKLKQLIGNNEYLQKRVSFLEDEKIDLLKQNTEISKEKSDIINSLESKEKHIENLLRENKKTEASMEQKRKHAEEKDRELESRNQELQRLRNKYDDLEGKLMDAESIAEDASSRVQAEQEISITMTKEKEELERSFSEMEVRVRITDQKLEHELSQGKLRQRTISQLQSENQFLRKQVTEISKAKDDALFRMRDMAENKLSRSSTSVKDIIDNNKPSKIAEIFWDLYDNGWKAAYREVNPVLGKEEETVKLLFDVLKMAYEMCVETAQLYNQQLHSAIHTIPSAERKKDGTTFSSDVQVQKTLSDIISTMGTSAGSTVEDLFVPQLQSKLSGVMPSDHLTMDSTYMYGRRCVSVCWSMRIRDPPLYLEFKWRQGSPFNENLYKSYMKSGKQIKLGVWPVLYLHEKGPLLSKGVAQAY